MKAFIVDRYGKSAALRFGDMPEPVLRDGDVLVAVRAAGLNLLDSKIRAGAFKAFLRYRAPFILGHDVAGTVVRVGPNVRRFKPGDEIYARPRDGRIGTFAERIAVDQADVALKPGNLDMAEAASIPLVGLTAWQVLVEQAGLKKGQKILIHAGSGGKLISISGPPDPDYAREQRLSWFLRQVMRLLSFGIRRQARRRGIRYSFLFMRASGEQLRQIASLIEAGTIRPVVDRVFPFEATNEAMEYIETGRSKGKVVVKLG